MYVLAGILDAFVNPWLLSGLALLSAPVIIHLLNKRHYTVVDWAAMDFLLQADSRNRRRLRIEDMVLLLLRMALLALVVFAVSRPLLSGLGGPREDERIVVLDDSFSMEAAEGTGTALLRARAAAASLVEEAVGQSIPVSVWSGTRPDRGSVDLAAPRSEDGTPVVDEAARDGAARLLADVRGREATDLSLRLGTILGRLAESTGEGEKASRRRVLALVSDFRRVDWLEPESDALRSDLAQPLLALKQKGALEGIRWRFVDVGQPARENLAVVGVRLASEHPIARVASRIVVEIRNFGSEDRRHVTGEIEVYALDLPGGSTVGSSGGLEKPALRTLHRIPFPAIDVIPAGKTAAAEVDFTFAEPGIYPLSAQIEGDHLPRDDRSIGVALVREGLRVLVVDGDPGTGRFSGESGFLLPALAPRGSLPSGLLPRRFVGELTPKELRDADVLMCLNRERYSPAEVEAIEGFLRRGGGAAIFLGNRVRPEAFAGWKSFPAVLAASREAKPRVRMRLGGDPGGFALFRGIEGSSLERVGFDRLFDLAPAKEAHVHAAFDDPAATPAVLSLAVGKGTLALFNMTADRDWSDWPADPSYPIVLQEWARHLALRRSGASLATAGEPLVWEAVPGVRYSVSPPEAPPHPAKAANTGATQIIEGDTSRSGFYVIIPSAATSGEVDPEAIRPLVFACRRDARDSDLEPVGEARLRSALGAYGVEVAFGRDPSTDLTRENENEGEVWRWTAYAAGMVLLLELFVAWWFGRQ